MIQEHGADLLATLREALSSGSPLARLLALIEPTKKLARMLGGDGASVLETRLCSSCVPHGGFSAHCTRELSGAQGTDEPGDSHHATPLIPR